MFIPVKRKFVMIKSTGKMGKSLRIGEYDNNQGCTAGREAHQTRRLFAGLLLGQVGSWLAKPIGSLGCHY